MNQQRAMRKADQQVFAAPADDLDAAAGQQRRQIGREWPAQSAAAHHDTGDRAALEMRRDTAARDLDLG